MRTQKPASGVGSNQYADRGSSTHKVSSRSRREVTAAMVSAVSEEIDIEATAVAFGGGSTDLSAARSGHDMIRAVAGGSDYARKKIAERKNCPAALLVFLSDDADAGVRIAVAENPNCPPEACAVIALNAPNRDGVLALEHPNCPPVAIQAFVDGLPDDLTPALRAPNCPPSILVDTAEQTKDLDDIRLIGENKNTPVWLLRAFVERHNGYTKNFRDAGADGRVSAVLGAVCRNPSSPPDLLDTLAVSGRTVGVALNPTTSPDTLVRIVELTRYDPRNGATDALKHPSFPVEQLEPVIRAGMEMYGDTEKMGRAASENPQITGRLLVDAACFYRGPALLRVLDDPDCPEEAFVAVTKVHDKPAWRAAVKHPKCPSRVLCQMAFSVDPVTARHVISNPNTPYTVLSEMGWRASNEKTKALAIAEATRREGSNDSRYVT